MDDPGAENWPEYERDGFLVLRALFTAAEVAEIRETFVAQNAGGPVPGLSEINASFAPGDPLSLYPRMMNPHVRLDLPVGPVARRYLLDPRLYPVVRALLETEPVAAQSMFYFKPPGARGQELHQDNFYLRVKPGTCLAAWIAVDDADTENGGIKIARGSHHARIACPEQADLYTSFTTDYVPPPQGVEPVHVDMKAGDVLFFNGSSIHGSAPNASPTRFRRSLIFHYVPRDSQELADWYRDPLTFDGEIVRIPAATGGGPCGAAKATGPH